MTRIRKAVFPVAGLGTRFLPATKAMPKELLPIIDKPIVQYAVEEAIAAGITDIIFVTGRPKRAIGDHFDANLELEFQLSQKGKHKERDMVRNIIPEGVNCIFIRQPEPKGLGDAVLCAAPAVGDAPFAVLLADDLMKGNTLPTAEMVAAYEQNPTNYLCVTEVEDDVVHKYGIVKPGPKGPDGRVTVAGLVEKPKLEDAPSHLASMGRYVFNAEIFDVLRKLEPGAGGEIQLADAIDILAEKGKVAAMEMSAHRYDCGSKFGYLNAIVDYAIDHDEFRDKFYDLMRERLAEHDAATKASAKAGL
ncbi:UTP--glucose-1-phosphate uridylyltransferase GalU [Rhodobacter sp. NTK016B]|uniref:UTP--glucose-1-phosphate uridylyltransferase GalU n=1 Tax=Rhodobacter sp. NTK016B TaxID=2759676 RepID=UPI001A8D904E|nr:UTP--glucose-1-phosphate uridylyltransferase GalU [Rhodobacter sp. NTK016B]MBN8294861.1 UTP--glucose-1-phosphate uridylyltransferase GalU [Rhodobacter sp. NTK016B]